MGERQNQCEHAALVWVTPFQRGGYPVLLEVATVGQRLDAIGPSLNEEPPDENTQDKARPTEESTRCDQSLIALSLSRQVYLPVAFTGARVDLCLFQFLLRQSAHRPTRVRLNEY